MTDNPIVGPEFGRLQVVRYFFICPRAIFSAVIGMD